MESKKKSRMPSLATQIFIGLIAGVIFGALFPDIGKSLKPLGDAFIRMIKMIVVPLIFSSLIMGIAGTGDFKKLGVLGGKSVIWFEFATTIALIVGLFKDGCYVQSGPMQKADYFKLLPTIKGV